MHDSKSVEFPLRSTKGAFVEACIQSCINCWTSDSVRQKNNPVIDFLSDRTSCVVCVWLRTAFSSVMYLLWYGQYDMRSWKSLRPLMPLHHCVTARQGRFSWDPSCTHANLCRCFSYSKLKITSRHWYVGVIPFCSLYSSLFSGFPFLFIF